MYGWGFGFLKMLKQGTAGFLDSWKCAKVWLSYGWGVIWIKKQK